MRWRHINTNGAPRTSLCPSAAALSRRRREARAAKEDRAARRPGGGGRVARRLGGGDHGRTDVDSRADPRHHIGFRCEEDSNRETESPATTSEYPGFCSARRIFDATAVFAAVRAPRCSAPVVGSRTGPRMAPAASCGQKCNRWHIIPEFLMEIWQLCDVFCVTSVRRCFKTVATPGSVVRRVGRPRAATTTNPGAAARRPPRVETGCSRNASQCCQCESSVEPPK